MTFDTIEEIAFGQLRVSPEVLDRINYRQFTNMVNGYRKEKDLESRERYVQMRKLMWASIVSGGLMKKGFQEKDIMVFPWETDIVKKISQEEHSKLVEGVEAVKAFYQRIDAGKNKA